MIAGAPRPIPPPRPRRRRGIASRRTDGPPRGARRFEALLLWGSPLPLATNRLDRPGESPACAPASGRPPMYRRRLGVSLGGSPFCAPPSGTSHIRLRRLGASPGRVALLGDPSIGIRTWTPIMPLQSYTDSRLAGDPARPMGPRARRSCRLLGGGSAHAVGWAHQGAAVRGFAVGGRRGSVRGGSGHSPGGSSSWATPRLELEHGWNENIIQT